MTALAHSRSGHDRNLSMYAAKSASPALMGGHADFVGIKMMPIGMLCALTFSLALSMFSAWRRLLRRTRSTFTTAKGASGLTCRVNDKNEWWRSNRRRQRR